MSTEANRITELATKLGFNPVTLEKVIRLGEALELINEFLPEYSQQLALRGGTPLNLATDRAVPYRLSIDLDFDIVTELSGPDLDAFRDELETKLVGGFKKKGFNPGRARGFHSGGAIRIQYQSYFHRTEQIKLDLNYLNRKPFIPPVKTKLWQPEGFVRPSAQVISLPEIVTGKICALIDRAAPRDFFDVYTLGEVGLGNAIGGDNRKYFLVGLSMLREPFWKRLKRKPLLVTQAAVEAELDIVISHQVDGNKLTSIVQSLLASHLTLSENERSFIEKINVGELKTELISSDKAFQGKLHSHPGLQWKLKNAQEHSLSRS